MKNTKNLTDLIVIISLAAFVGACSPPAAETAVPATASLTVTIMTFNVENLFDNDDDEGKDDKTFFALADKQSEEHKSACADIAVQRWRDQCLDWDWNDRIIEHKLSVIANAILQVNDGRGADIVALQEVENIDIVERLRTEYLGDSGYLPTVLIEGHDLRGIDVAFLTRLELASDPVLHEPHFSGVEKKRVLDTRGILQADFTLPDGSVLTGFAVHFPAPFHPTGMRDAAYAHLNQLQSDLPVDRPVFAAGDFNTTAKEDRENDMLAKHARPSWTVVHELGCGACKGTHYYAAGDDWSFLDMLLWSAGRDRGAQATWNLRNKSLYVANGAPDQVRADGTPARFQLPEGTGVSDHWPLVMTVESN